MSAPVIGSAEAVKIARNLGKAGRPLPAGIAGVPGARAAYDEAAGVTPAPAPAPAPSSQPSPAAPRGRQPARTRPASRRPSTRTAPAAGYGSRAFSPSAAAGRVADATGMRSVARGGDAGGLLLVLVLYPVALATLKYGANGPAVWFKAKWLNQATDPASLTPGRPTTPTGRPLPKTRNPLPGGIVINGGSFTGGIA